MPTRPNRSSAASRVSVATRWEGVVLRPSGITLYPTLGPDGTATEIRGPDRTLLTVVISGVEGDPLAPFAGAMNPLLAAAWSGLRYGQGPPQPWAVAIGALPADQSLPQVSFLNRLRPSSAVLHGRTQTVRRVGDLWVAQAAQLFAAVYVSSGTSHCGRRFRPLRLAIAA